MTEIKGYKATRLDGFPLFGKRRTPYEAGRTYRAPGQPVLCRNGLHFSPVLCAVYHYCDIGYDIRVFHVAASGRWAGGWPDDGDKMCASTLAFIDEMPPKDILKQLDDDGVDRQAGTGWNAYYQICRLLESLLTPPAKLGLGPHQGGRLSGLLELAAARRRQFAEAFLEMRGQPLVKAAMGVVIGVRKLTRMLDTEMA